MFPHPFLSLPLFPSLSHYFLLLLSISFSLSIATSNVLINAEPNGDKSVASSLPFSFPGLIHEPKLTSRLIGCWTNWKSSNE